MLNTKQLSTKNKENSIKRMDNSITFLQKDYSS